MSTNTINKYVIQNQEVNTVIDRRTCDRLDAFRVYTSELKGKLISFYGDRTYVIRLHEHARQASSM